MKIFITFGTGEAETELSAFDKALCDAGVIHYNLIRLSSVIPASSEISVEKFKPDPKEHGYKLYVVLSKSIETKPGNEAYSGIGWVTQKNNSGKGLFVEHQGNSEEEVKELIMTSLKNMQEYRSDEYGAINHKIIGIKCKDKPVCAVVVAVYKSEDWN